MIRKISLFFIVILAFFEALNLFKILDFKVFFTWLGLFITAITGIILLESINLYFKKKIRQSLKKWIYPCTAFLLYFDALGDILKFYKISWYDQIAHFMAGSLIALMLYFIFHQLNFSISLRCKLLFVFCILSTLGTIYEIEEYLEDVFFHSNRLGDGYDTANDLLMNNSGAFITLLIIYLIWHVRRNNTANSYSSPNRNI